MVLTDARRPARALFAYIEDLSRLIPGLAV
jgi:hypothetical protein